MEEHRELLDLPDELLIRILAGAGGMGVGAAAISCRRLRNVAARLHTLPVFSSALSTKQSLQAAIKDAGQRALSGCFGPVDFAVLFCANYGNRHKKYRDPTTDLTHAVDMLREVLGQDVAVVGCACAGIMGVGPDSQPIEVDPTCTTQLGRAAAAARKKKAAAAAAAAGAGGSGASSGEGLQQQLLPPPPSPPPLPTKGVAVLLGKMPPGCVARTFAQEVVSGPPVPREPDSGSPTPPESWSWPFMNDVLALSDSQQQHLRQQLQQQPMPTTTTTVAAAGRGVSPAWNVPGAAAGAEAASQAEAAVAMELGAASPDTAAAAEGLMSVVAAAAAAAAAGDDAGGAAASGDPAGAAGGNGNSVGGGVELVPQLCFLLYDSSLQSFGYTASEEMEKALRYMAARGIAVVGGASSGAGDLFYSPGANGSRVLGEPPAHPQLVGLMLCTAKASLAANPQPLSQQQQQPAAAAPAAAQRNNSNSTAQIASSDPALLSVAYASRGLGPAEGAPLFTAARARLVSSHALSVSDTVTVYFNVEACTPVYNNQQQRAATTTAVAAAAAAAGDDGGGGTGGSSGGDEGGSGPTSAAGTTAADAAPMRRSARLAAGAPSSSASQQQQQQQRGQPMVPPSFGLTPLEQLFACLLSALPDDDTEDDEERDEEEGPFLAVWEADEEGGGGSGCGGSSAAAAGFTGDEKQVALCHLLDTDLSHVTTNNTNANSSNNNSRTDVVEVTVRVPASGYAVLKRLLNKPHHSLCMQVVDTKGAACARTVRRGVSQLLPLVHHNTHAPQQAQLLPPPLPAAGTADAQQAVVSGDCSASASDDYYAALARCAAASGARSGLQALTVCSCTGRGQGLYCGAPGAAAAAGLEGVVASSGGDCEYGDVCEARIIDSVSGGSVPFVGVYVAGELGPEVQHMCRGWCKPLAGHSGGGGSNSGGEGSRQVAEMQGFTSMFAGWGCRPGAA